MNIYHKLKIKFFLSSITSFYKSSIWTFDRLSLLSSFEINCPTLISSSNYTPWSIPKSSHIYTTSSVETFPDAPLAYGHPPIPATLLSIIFIPWDRETTRF